MKPISRRNHSTSFSGITTAQRVVLALLLACLLAGISTGVVLYFRLAYLWAFLFFGAWIWAALSLRGLVIQRTSRTLRAQVGQIFEERFELKNTGRLPRLWLEVHDKSALPGATGSRILTLVTGRQTRSYLARTRLLQRGAFPLGPTVLLSGDILGMFPVRTSIPANDTLLVYPMMVEITTFPNPPGLLPGGEALRRRTHQVTPNAAGIREYYPGDPLNRIHWASTAHRDRFMVKEFELDPMADVWLILDSAKMVQAALPSPEMIQVERDIWRANVKIPLPASTEEYGVSIAASLARYFLRRGRAVGLVSAGKHPTLIPPDRGGRQLGKLLEALALSRAEGRVPLRGLVETQARHLPRGSTVVIVTPSVFSELVLVADFLLRRGLRPVVILLQADTFGGLKGSDQLAVNLRTLGVPVCLVPNGADLETVLCQENGTGKRQHFVYGQSEGM